MSHLSGRCTCGRAIHFSKGSTYGDSWTCYNCGKTWYIMQHGDIPLHNRRSKAPSENSCSGGGTGCMVPLVIAGIAMFVAGCVLS